MLWEGNTVPLADLFLPGACQPAYKCEGRSCLGRIASIPRPPPPTCQPSQLLHQPAVAASMHSALLYLYLHIFGLTRSKQTSS